jgi:hypothetical protein
VTPSPAPPRIPRPPMGPRRPARLAGAVPARRHRVGRPVRVPAHPDAPGQGRPARHLRPRVPADVAMISRHGNDTVIGFIPGPDIDEGAGSHAGGLTKARDAFQALMGWRGKPALGSYTYPSGGKSEVWDFARAQGAGPMSYRSFAIPKGFTPADVHAGKCDQIWAARAADMVAAGFGEGWYAPGYEGNGKNFNGGAGLVGVEEWAYAVSRQIRVMRTVKGWDNWVSINFTATAARANGLDPVKAYSLDHRAVPVGRPRPLPDRRLHRRLVGLERPRTRPGRSCSSSWSTSRRSRPSTACRSTSASGDRCAAPTGTPRTGISTPSSARRLGPGQRRRRAVDLQRRQPPRRHVPVRRVRRLELRTRRHRRAPLWRLCSRSRPSSNPCST